MAMRYRSALTHSTALVRMLNEAFHISAVPLHHPSFLSLTVPWLMPLPYSSHPAKLLGTAFLTATKLSFLFSCQDGFLFRGQWLARLGFILQVGRQRTFQYLLQR